MRSLHPDMRKAIRRALDDLAAGKRQNVKRLVGQLRGFSRLRVGKYRLVFDPFSASGEIIVEYLDSREGAYERYP